MKFGELIIKQKALSDDVGSVQLDVAVTGTNGGGHARISLTHAGPDMPWKFQGGDFFSDTGRPLHLDAR